MKRDRFAAKPHGAEGLTGEALALGLRVDGGQHAVRPHALEQVDARYAGPRTDFGHRFGVGGGGEQPQCRTGAGRDRGQAGVAGPVAGPAQGFVLGDKRVGEGPARLPVGGNGPLLSP